MAANADQSTRKNLALAIINFLNNSVEDGTLPSDDRDSIEVATNCIAESFKVDPSEASSSKNLLSIFAESEKNSASTFQAKASSSTAGTQEASSSTANTSSSASSTGKNPEAESLKGQGNVAMQAKNYDEAIRLYTEAINIQPTNPIYLSNRAAAYSAIKQHDLAKQDAEVAVASDPKYTKAWSRLGLARYALGDPKGSMEAYSNGIEAEGSGGSEAMRKGYETAKKRVEELGMDDDDDDDEQDRAPAAQGGAGGMPDLSSLAGMFGGGGGGMPDIGAMMNNPMMRQMAQNLMSNPSAMSNLMNNPQLRNLANQFGGGGGAGGEGGGGGMPDLGSLMSDPSIAEMARNFMGGMGGAGRGAGRGT